MDVTNSLVISQTSRSRPIYSIAETFQYTCTEMQIFTFSMLPPSPTVSTIICLKCSTHPHDNHVMYPYVKTCMNMCMSLKVCRLCKSCRIFVIHTMMEYEVLSILQYLINEIVVMQPKKSLLLYCQLQYIIYVQYTARGCTLGFINQVSIHGQSKFRSAVHSSFIVWITAMLHTRIMQSTVLVLFHCSVTSTCLPLL